MELRKDPITRSWVAIRDGEPREPAPEPCPYCPGGDFSAARPLLSLPEFAAAPPARPLPPHYPLFPIPSHTPPRGPPREGGRAGRRRTKWWSSSPPTTAA